VAHDLKMIDLKTNIQKSTIETTARRERREASSSPISGHSNRNNFVNWLKISLLLYTPAG